VNYYCEYIIRYYKAPELFLGYHFYDYSVDMWSFGCVLGAIVDKICFYLLKIF
jgi:serine/threonine protein kinase